MSTDEAKPIDGEGKIDPSQFPVPKTMQHVLVMRAERLRNGGQGMEQAGEDIVQAWSGLEECYTAPEAPTLYTALKPVASNGRVVGSATNRVANALDDFAEAVGEIKAKWRDLTADANAFRAEIEDEGEDWNKGDGLFGWGDSANAEKNTGLLLRAANLVEEFNQAEVACANRINLGLDGRTDFLGADDLDGAMPDANQFVHGVGVELSEIPTAWGEAAASTDYGWARDVGDAIWDFGVGAVEGTGAMLGMHSSEGWFAQSWGDSIKEYHWDNITSAAALVGMYDAESDSLGWTGGEGVKEAWKDLAHSVVPWEEWGDRPGYVIGTAVLNIGAMVGGAVLTATGVGAVVGVPLMAWRGAAILDGMGSSGRGGSGMDVDLSNLPDMPTFGGAGAPVVNIDTSQFTPAQAAELTASLEQLNTATTGNSSGGAGGSHTNESTTGNSGRSNQTASASPETDPNKAKKPTARHEGAESESSRSDDALESPTITARSDTDDVADNTASQQRQDETAESTSLSQEELAQLPTTGQAKVSDEMLSRAVSPGDMADIKADGRKVVAEFNETRKVDREFQTNPELKGTDAELDHRWGADPANGKKPLEPGGPELVSTSAGGSNNGTFDQAASSPSTPSRSINVSDVDAPGPNNRLGNEASGNNSTGSNGPNAQSSGPSNDQHLRQNDIEGQSSDANRSGERDPSANTPTDRSGDGPQARDHGPTTTNQASTVNDGTSRTSDNTSSERIRNDEGAYTGDRSSAGPGRESSSGEGYSSLPGLGESSSGSGNGGGSSNNSGGTSGAPSGGRYDGESNRPPYNPPKKTIDPDNENYLGKNRRFGTDKDGNDVKLAPNTLYEVDGRGTFITDSSGKIIHVETKPGQSSAGNPELNYPRPNAKYFVKHPTSGAQFVYETDQKSRTISIEGELKTGKTPRGGEQTPIGHEGKHYFKKYNSDEQGVYTYEDVNWDGGHFVAANYFGGPGERINVIPMLKSINHVGKSPDYRTNWGRMENLWNGLLQRDISEIKKAFRRPRDGSPDMREDMAREWLSRAGSGDTPPSITFSMKIGYSDSLPEYGRKEFSEWQDKIKKNPDRERYNRNRPKDDDIIGEPPNLIAVDWSLNGSTQERLLHENHPERERR
ncbi:DNA/RNA non-specific endonuclease [Nocardiopsis exhalans]|uniref:DNA/RNA non-specific endonuclease n=1 Tax=Nocardiopsis exhalans TaxID=163604 RepID=A0ABY5D941_9ACTN|nr:DNA/RNA non-specific endonuclease [Nocardiopsis exhalans]USY20864.1 DNA/RNA non-specific endonuclease [Nocardiopsis exhalans]